MASVEGGRGVGDMASVEGGRVVDDMASVKGGRGGDNVAASVEGGGNIFSYISAGMRRRVGEFFQST